MNPTLNETALRPTREIIREEPLMHTPILAALADGPLTIPAIAERIGGSRLGRPCSG